MGSASKNNLPAKAGKKAVSKKVKELDEMVKLKLKIGFNPNVKFTLEALLKEMAGLYAWYNETPTACTFSQYFTTPGSGSAMSYSQYKNLKNKFRDEDIVKDASYSLKQMQEARIVDQAMNNKWNPQFAIFMLKNRHGYEDKNTQELKVQENVKFKFGNYDAPDENNYSEDGQM